MPTLPTTSGAGARDDRARHVFYLEGSTLLLTGTASLNYEYTFARHWSVRGGFGAGYAILPIIPIFWHEEWYAVGPQFMINALAFGPDHYLEFGLGAAILYMNTNSRFLLVFGAGGSHSIQPLPAVTLGYRYQPDQSGPVVRIGAAWTYGLGFPLEASFGWVF